MQLLAQIAPQRSTQYSALASALAPQELRLSSLGAHLTAIEPATLGGQRYLKLDLRDEVERAAIQSLGTLAMTSALFDYYPQLGEHTGPFLRPIEMDFSPALPPDLMMTRRYKGKTNELFTLFLCNVARFSSGVANQPWNALRVFDPLAGGGTTLFAALMLGADAMGVETTEADVESTVAFIRQYAREQSLSCQIREERLKKVGKRWHCTFNGAAGGATGTHQLVLARGDTTRSVELLNQVKRPHLIVTDLPYGIQHTSGDELSKLLRQALPVWASLLQAGGVITFAWESTRFPREEMIALVESSAPLKVLNEPPYDQLTHRVDRVIKQRDVIVARVQMSDSRSPISDAKAQTAEPKPNQANLTSDV